MTDMLTPRELAREIREKVKDINDLVILAAINELDIKFDIRKIEHAPRVQELTVYISQEV